MLGWIYFASAEIQKLSTEVKNYKIMKLDLRTSISLRFWLKLDDLGCGAKLSLRHCLENALRNYLGSYF